MPFVRTDVPPSTTPPVVVKFSGLMVLQPGQMTGTCQIGIHKLDRGHQFQLLLMVSKPNPLATGQPHLPPLLPPIMIPLITGDLTAPVLVRLEPDPNPGAGNFEVFAKDPFDRTANSHPNDYRWGINLRSKHLDADINDGARPAATLKTGVLYSPDLTNPAIDPELICPGTTEKLNQIAPHFAVSITRPANTSLLIEWRDEGNPRNVLLPRTGDPAGTVYTVYFINEPPNFDGLPHDELPLYYRILQSGGSEIPGHQQCKLKFAPGHRNDEIPCMPIVLNP